MHTVPTALATALYPEVEQGLSGSSTKYCWTLASGRAVGWGRCSSLHSARGIWEVTSAQWGTNLERLAVVCKETGLPPLPSVL